MPDVRLAILGPDDKIPSDLLPATANVAPATTTVAGVVELATNAETTTGTDTVRAVTPSGVKAVADTKAAVSHTHTSANVTDFAEAVQDVVGAMVVSGGNVTWTYDDVTNKLNLTVSTGSTGVDAETIRDTIGAAIIGVNSVGVTINDAADTITFGITGLTISQVTGLQDALNASNAAATTTAAGHVELATNTEAAAGTDTVRAVTPAGVKAALDASGVDQLSVIYPVRLAASGNQSLAPAALPIIDSVQVLEGDTVLLPFQNTASQNGVYIASATGWVRHPSFDTAAEMASRTVRITEGAFRGGFLYHTNFRPSSTIGTTSVVWSRVLEGNMMDAKGDLLVGYFNDQVVRLPAGSTGQLLVVDPTTESGLRYTSEVPASMLTQLDLVLTDSPVINSKVNMPSEGGMVMMKQFSSSPTDARVSSDTVSVAVTWVTTYSQAPANWVAHDDQIVVL